MAESWKEQVIHLVMNPLELRAIADQMDRQYSAGGPPQVAQVNIDQTTKLNIYLDKNFYTRQEVQNQIPQSNSSNPTEGVPTGQEVRPTGEVSGFSNDENVSSQSESE